METPAPRRKFNELVLWMLLLGLFAIWAGASDIGRHWPTLVFGAKLCDVLIVVAGARRVVAGAARLLIRRMNPVVAALGAAGAGLFSVTLLIGVWSGAIPCSGPG
jgi:hypothetical protein